MKETRILLSFLWVFYLGCHSQKEDKSNDDNNPQETHVKPDTFPADSGRTVSTQYAIQGMKDTLILHLKMSTKLKHFEIPVYVSKTKKLLGTLTSEDPKANIRFSQIGMPDGTLDGPFGTELEYDLKGEGTYKLIIGQNMMAGDPWSGDFTLTVWGK